MQRAVLTVSLVVVVGGCGEPEEPDEPNEPGPGECVDDGDCSDEGGLCDVDGAFGDAGRCLPPVGTVDCAGDDAVDAPPRDADGPVIFALTAFFSPDGCYDNVTAKFFDRQGDVSATSPLAEIFVDGEPRVATPLVDGDTIDLGFTCSASPNRTSGLLLRDGAGNASNTLCLIPE